MFVAGSVIFNRFMPESPRWLLTSGRFEEAVQILTKMAKVNGRQFTDLHLQKLKVGINVILKLIIKH